MSDPLAPHQGLFLDALEELDRPGEVIRNLLRGNKRAAGRKAVDFFDAPLRLLPFGDRLVPELSKPEDAISGGDLVGLHDPGWKKTLADIAVGIGTDPLSLVSFGAGQGVKIAGKTVAAAGKTVDPLTLGIKGAKHAIKAGAKAGDMLANLGRESSTVRTTPVSDIVKKVGQTSRNALGWHDLTELQKEHLNTSRSKGAKYAKAGLEEAHRLMKGLTAEEQVALGDAFDAIHFKEGKAVGLLNGANVHQRIQELAIHNPKLRVAEMQRAAGDITALSDTQLGEAVRAGGFKPMDAEKPKTEYLARKFVGKGLETNPLDERKLQTPAQLLDYLQKMPEGVQYERNALRRLSERAATQGRMVEKAELARRVLGNPHANLIDDGALMRQTIQDIGEKSPDWAYRLDQAFNGTAPRGWWTTFLNTANKAFKPAVTAGLALPRVGFMTKNQLGMVWQAFSQPGVPLSTQRHAVRNYFNAFDDGWEKVTNSRLGDALPGQRSRLTDAMKLIEEAHRQARGSGEGVTKWLKAQGREDLAEAVDHGVMDGFISSEDVIKQVNRDHSWRSLPANILDAPAAIMQGQEQRARLGTFLDLRDRDGAAKAAKLARETFLDYTVSGEANRTLRDHVPFAQFLVKSIPQQASLLSRSPATAAGVAALFNQDQGLPKYDWLRQQASIPVGLDEQGNAKYLTSVGLPVEALASIPDGSGASFEKLIGQTQPLLKTGYAYASGHDPSFGTPFGSYDREPITGNHSKLGQVYNTIAGTGLTAPIDTPIRQLSTLLDKRRSGADKAASLLLGARVASVDADLAEQRDLTSVLNRNPQVRQYTSYYQESKDPEVDAVLKKLKEAKARLKEKRAHSQPDTLHAERGVDHAQSMVERYVKDRDAIVADAKVSPDEKAKKVREIRARIRALGDEAVPTP